MSQIYIKISKIRNVSNDSESGENTWWRGEVVDVDFDSENPKNPDFFVTYNDYESEDKENEWFLMPLFEDYLKGSIYSICRCLYFFR